MTVPQEPSTTTPTDTNIGSTSYTMHQGHTRILLYIHRTS